MLEQNEEDYYGKTWLKLQCYLEIRYNAHMENHAVVKLYAKP